MTDLLSERCGDLLTGNYDCPDRIVLNAYYQMGHAPGGFRVWWRRWHSDGDEQLDNAHLMRLAGRFARRLRASAQAHGIPVIDCKAGERKRRIAEEYLTEHPAVRVGVFLILVSRSPALVWKVDWSAKGVIHHLEKTRQFVNHYSFHIIDPTWGHVTIKISGHPPFGALRKLRGKQLVLKPGRTRRYHVPSSPHEPSPRCSPSATRSSRHSPPGSAHHDEVAHPRPGPPSTATTKPSAAA